MLRYMLPLALVLGLSASCYSDEGVGYSYGSPYYGDDYGYVSPGVDVVYGYDYPLYFADGYYWRSYGGHWYRSHYRDRGWAYAPHVSGHMRGIARGGFHGGFHGTYRGGYHGGYHGGFHGNAQAFRGSRGGFHGGHGGRGGHGGHHR